MAKILIVEDNSDIAEVMREWLEMEDHEVHWAENGLIGIEMALKLKPNLILTDMHMPVMGGQEAVRLLRDQHHYTGKIIAVTASVMAMDIAEIRKSGCNGIISKPIGEDFYKLVESFLQV